jgi:hypothetical protein
MSSIPVAELLNQVLVQVTVRNGRLHAYPQRTRDIVVFHEDPSDPQRRPSPVKPREIRWLVHGLAENERIEFVPVAGQTQQLANMSGTMCREGPGVHTLTSGAPRTGPGHGREDLWEYDLVLYRDDKEVDRIDPTIIIKEDP